MTIRYLEILDIIVLYQQTKSNQLTVSIEDSIELDHSIDPDIGILFLNVSDHIDLDHEVNNNIHGLSVEHHIGITEYLNVGKIYDRLISHNISFNSRVVRNKIADITQSIILNHEATITPLLPSVILLDQGVSYNTSKPLLDTIELDHGVILNKTKVLSLNHHVELNSYPRVYKFDVHFFATTIDPVLANHKIILIYGPITLQLRDPEFEDSVKYEQSRILRRNRGNELHIYRDKALAWPTTQTLNYSFKYLSQKNVSDLLYFMQISLGQKIQLQDHESNNWEGIIITPEALMIEESITGFTASFEFQGERI